MMSLKMSEPDNLHSDHYDGESETREKPADKSVEDGRVQDTFHETEIPEVKGSCGDRKELLSIVQFDEELRCNTAEI